MGCPPHHNAAVHSTQQERGDYTVREPRVAVSSSLECTQRRGSRDQGGQTPPTITDHRPSCAIAIAIHVMIFAMKDRRATRHRQEPALAFSLWSSRAAHH